MQLHKLEIFPRISQSPKQVVYVKLLGQFPIKGAIRKVVWAIDSFWAKTDKGFRQIHDYDELMPLFPNRPSELGIPNLYMECDVGDDSVYMAKIANRIDTRGMVLEY